MMIFSYARLAGLILILFLTVTVHAQTTVSTHVGRIETLHDDPSLPSYAFYPQVEIDTGLVRSDRTRLALDGSLHVGGWVDGVEEPSRGRDVITYAYSSFVLGARLSVALEEFPLLLTFLGGVLQHVLFAEYIGGAGVSGNIGRDHRDAYRAAEASLRLHLPVGNRFQIGGEALVLLALPVSSSNPHRTRVACSLVTTYAL